jgi:hypothetical protein
MYSVRFNYDIERCYGLRFSQASRNVQNEGVWGGGCVQVS